MQDLTELTINEEGAVLHLRHPVTDTPLTHEDGRPVTITLLSTESRKLVAHAHETQNRRLKKTIRKGGKVTPPTAEELEADALELYIEATVDWDLIPFDGKTLECTVPNCRLVYTKARWIRDQVDEFITDRAEHMGKPSRSS